MSSAPSPVRADRQPHLHIDVPAGPVRAVALVLHGGRAHSVAPVQGRQLAVLRMAPFGAALHRGGTTRGLAVARLRYLVRGWNGAEQSPVGDVRWALDRVAERFPDVRVALVGHSMGGRAALHCAGQPAVRAVVALAPWLEPGDPDRQLAGRDVLIAHGALDRTTSPAASAAYAERAAPVAASVGYVAIRHERHAMLRRPRLWHELAAGFVLAVICGAAPSEVAAGPAAAVVTQVLAGQRHLVV
jgi:alpha-beta hydrolase superfamily lysophospholipase